MNRQRILGIDPGLNRTGYGVIEVEGNHLRCVDAGVIRVPTGTLAQRLQVILVELGSVIRATVPASATVEKVFVNVNPQSTLLLGQARGAAICAAVSAGLEVSEHTALQVKQAVVGYGKADKRQVQMMVQRLLNLSRAPGTDAADALACAICEAHARSNLQRSLLAAAGASATAGGGRARRSRAAWRALGDRLRDPPGGHLTPHSES